MFTDYIRDKYVKLFRIYTKLNCYKLFKLYSYTKVKDKYSFCFNIIQYNEDSDIKDIKINIDYFYISYYFREKIIDLPISIKGLHFGFNNQRNITLQYNYSFDFLGNLPNLKQLILEINIVQNIDVLPKSLKLLVIYYNDKRLIKCPVNNIKVQHLIW